MAGPANPDEAVAALEAALAGRSDLDQYGSNKRLLSAVQWIFGVDDIDTLAAEALTDGGDDKSCDLIWVNRDAGVILLAQGYEASNTGRPAAPQGKAASLHQAVTWVLAHDIAKMPARLRPAVHEVRSALKAGIIREIRIWFVHNLPESDNVRHEMEAITSHVSGALAARYPESRVDIHATEIGRYELAGWYQSSRTPILVRDRIVVPVDDCAPTFGPKWESCTVTVRAEWLNGMYWAYRDKLFSANIRGYLGARRSAGNINNGIRETLLSEPGNFWIFNNGIKALVDDMEYLPEEGGLVIHGLSIVDGAQTTGVLANCQDDAALREASVAIRFVKCGDPATVQDLIRFNNRQNATEPADFRSNDRAQRRLAVEFADLGICYTGGRRGADMPQAPRGTVDVISVGQALAAYHGEPGVAYQEKRRIWEDDELYERLFSAETTARHALFCWALLKAVEKHKLTLRELPEKGVTKGKREQRAYFARRGSILLLVAAAGECVEPLLGSRIADSFQPGFTGKPAPEDAVAAWDPVVSALAAPASSWLDPLLGPSGPARDLDRAALRDFRHHIEAIIESLGELRAAFAARVRIG